MGLIGHHVFMRTALNNFNYTLGENPHIYLLGVSGLMILHNTIELCVCIIIEASRARIVFYHVYVRGS